VDSSSVALALPKEDSQRVDRLNQERSDKHGCEQEANNAYMIKMKATCSILIDNRRLTEEKEVLTCSGCMGSVALWSWDAHNTIGTTHTYKTTTNISSSCYKMLFFFDLRYVIDFDTTVTHQTNGGGPFIHFGWLGLRVSRCLASFCVHHVNR